MDAAIPSISQAEEDTVGATNPSSRRRACNECKQQKLRCIFSDTGESTSVSCSRCQRLGLDCRLEISFRRIRKRQYGRSHELETEVKELKRQLETIRSSGRSRSRSAVPPITSIGGQEAISPCFASSTGSISRAGYSKTPPCTIELSCDPGLTTQPIVDLPKTRRSQDVIHPQPRKLDDIELSIPEIDELFKLYFQHYHPFLPFLDMAKSPHAYYESSELLFWSIISVASRRFVELPALLPALSRNVTDLLWDGVRSVPYSLQVVQSLLLLSTWPFPTNSSTSDPTYVLAGIMVQAGTQMGLHYRTLGAPDFTKGHLDLTELELVDRSKAWEACNIVAHSVSVGCGLPPAVPILEWPLTFESMASSSSKSQLQCHLQIEKFRHRVTMALAPSSMTSGDKPSQERHSRYDLLEALLEEMKREIKSVSPSCITARDTFSDTHTVLLLLTMLADTTLVYLDAATLHLHSFYLFEHPLADGYTSRILTLYQSAHNYISRNIALEQQTGHLFQHWPFFCYQVFVAACFVILRISMNQTFQPLVDARAGRNLLYSGIWALRTMSVANNDLPARLADVIGFFLSRPDRQDIPEGSISHLPMQVRHRLSVSVVYDSLWKWRRHFQAKYSHDTSDQVDLFSGSDDSLAVLDEILMTEDFAFEWPENTPAFSLHEGVLTSGPTHASI